MPHHGKPNRNQTAVVDVSLIVLTGWSVTIECQENYGENPGGRRGRFSVGFRPVGLACAVGRTRAPACLRAGASRQARG